MLGGEAVFMFQSVLSGKFGGNLVIVPLLTQYINHVTPPHGSVNDL